MGGATNQYNRQRSAASNGGQKSNGTVWTVNHVLKDIKLTYRISSYSCRGNYSFLNSSSEETIQVFISLM